MSLFSLVLTPLRPGAALVRPATAVARPIGAAISIRPLSVIGQMATDVRSIAASTRELTVAVNQLADIDRRVGVLEDEVTKMRKGVDAIAADMTHVRESTEPLRRLAGPRARRRRAKAAEAV